MAKQGLWIYCTIYEQSTSLSRIIISLLPFSCYNLCLVRIVSKYGVIRRFFHKISLRLADERAHDNINFTFLQLVDNLCLNTGTWPHNNPDALIFLTALKIFLKPPPKKNSMYFLFRIDYRIYHWNRSSRPRLRSFFLFEDCNSPEEQATHTTATHLLWQSIRSLKTFNNFHIQHRKAYLWIKFTSHDAIPIIHIRTQKYPERKNISQASV